jgi:hypothetical protein
VDLIDFTEDITEYFVKCRETIPPVVTATAQDTNATVHITQANTFNDVATIIVTAQNGSIKTYIIHFLRNDNADLEGIKYGGVDLADFSANITEYSVLIRETTPPTITATANDPYATISIIQANTLNDVATITVTAQNGSKKTYTIHFKLSDNANLSSIKCNGVDLYGFSPDITEYTVPVREATPPLVTATAQDSKAVIATVHAQTLNSATTITVTAHNGSKKVYTIYFEPMIILLQSLHPYAIDTNQTYAYTLNGSYSSIKVTFSDKTKFQDEYDYVQIMDGANNIIGSNKYSGTSLANKTVTIPGNTIKVKLRSDHTVNDYGFEIIKVVGVN